MGIKSLRLKYRRKSHGDDLFAVLRENPNDRDTLAILGDWLEEQGDPIRKVISDYFKDRGMGESFPNYLDKVEREMAGLLSELTFQRDTMDLDEEDAQAYRERAIEIQSWLGYVRKFQRKLSLSD